MADSPDNVIRLAEHKGAFAGEDQTALAFAEQHANRLRYVAMWGKWLRFDDVRWTHDDTLHVFDLVRQISRDGPGSTSAKAVAAVERLARCDRRLAATIAQWDAQPWLLTSDGETAVTLDLRTGDSRTPDALDYITKKTACAVAPFGTQHPLWSTFLARVTDGNGELQQFLQRYVGYCLAGLTTEHVFVFAYGTGANGKSTFVNTIAGMFGDYATVADMSTFIASAGERHPTDLAKLAGARLVVAQETQKGRRWDETKVKAITGGDRITARFMRQDFFDFTPAFKLFVAGNHKPRLTSVDEAMRRRLLLVPFTVQIPPAERDADLPRKLQAEWPAILRWCVNGCLQWQQAGLAPPAVVRDATDSYFAEQDTLQQWLEDCTEDGGALAFTRLSELFASWKSWCEERNLRPGTSTTLSDLLAAKNYARKREPHTGHRGFAGVSLKKR